MSPLPPASSRPPPCPMTSRATWTGPCAPWRPPPPGRVPDSLPEMFLTGYLIRDQLAQLAEPTPNGPALTVLGQKAKALSLGGGHGHALGKPRRQAPTTPWS